MDYSPPPFQGPAAPVEPPAKPKRGRGRGAATGDEPAVTKKVVDRQRMLAIIAGGGLALVAAVTILGGTAPETYVVRAVEPIEAGLVLDVEAQFEALPVDNAYVEDGAITGNTPEAAMEQAVEDLDGLRVQYPIAEGQQIRAEFFNVEISLATPLTAEERLLSVSAGIGNALAGQIEVGDRVDVSATVNNVTAIIAQNIEVVAVTVSESQYQSLASQQTGEAKNTKDSELLPGDPIPGIYTLRVPVTLVPSVNAAAQGATLSLIYRSPEAKDLVPTATTALSAVCGDSTLEECQ